MPNFVTSFTNKIFNIQNDDDFRSVSIALFLHQYKHCKIYKEFTDYLKIDPNEVTTLEKIPFLPIQFFKNHFIISSYRNPKLCFESSATTGSVVSKHYVCSPEVYIESFSRHFESCFGNPKEIAILALLPSYLERSSSSLVYMVDYFIQQSSIAESGFFMYNTDELYTILSDLARRKQKTILFGVTFALLDFVEKFKIEFPDLIIIETGGMKGRKEEITRYQLQEQLCNGFGVQKVYSEYGMTELLSQGYTSGGVSFTAPAWMKVLVREPNDPLTVHKEGRNGGLNIIDLANIESCAFLATQDLGTVFADGSFEVLGRFDDSEIRGCNLMSV